MDPQQEERRGEDAKRVLNEDIYKEAWQVERERIVIALETETLTDAQVLDLRKDLLSLRRQRRRLEHYMTTGTMAAMEIERKRKLLDRFKRA